MATSKSGGSTNNRESHSKRLGCKISMDIKFLAAKLSFVSVELIFTQVNKFVVVAMIHYSLPLQASSNSILALKAANMFQ